MLKPIVDLLAGRTPGLAFRRAMASFPGIDISLMLLSLKALSLLGDPPTAVALTSSGLLLRCRPIAGNSLKENMPTAVSEWTDRSKQLFVGSKSAHAGARVHENTAPMVSIALRPSVYPKESDT